MARILLVDDEEDILWGLSDSLKKEGFEVLTAQDGEEALARLESGPFDLMVTDIRMPEMNGVELLLKAKELHPDLNVIVMTAYGSEELKKEVIEGGALHYLEKPFDFQDLFRMVEECTSGKTAPQPWELADVLQLLNLEGRSATLGISFKNKKGKIAVKDGEPWHAEFDDKRGEEAILRILSTPDVKYQVKFEFKGGERSIRKPLYALILEAIAGVDEAQREQAVTLLGRIGEKESEESPLSRDNMEEGKEVSEVKAEERVRPLEREEESPSEEGPEEKARLGGESTSEERPGGGEEARRKAETQSEETDITLDELEGILKSLGNNALICVFDREGRTMRELKSGIQFSLDGISVNLSKVIQIEHLERLGDLEEVIFRTSRCDVILRGGPKGETILALLPRKSPKTGMARILLEKLEVRHGKG